MDAPVAAADNDTEEWLQSSVPSLNYGNSPSIYSTSARSATASDPAKYFANAGEEELYLKERAERSARGESAPLPPPDKYILKIAVIGESGVGKTTLCSQFKWSDSVVNFLLSREQARHMGSRQKNDLDHIIEERMRPSSPEAITSTIGVDLHSQTIYLDTVTTAHVQLWDVAGQPRFRMIASSYYALADACVVVFDMTALQSFEEAKEWIKDFQRLCNNKNAPILMLANKRDLFDQVKDSAMAGDIETRLRIESILAMATDFCKAHSFHLAHVSALKGILVDKTLCEFARDVCHEKGYRKRNSADRHFALPREFELSRKTQQYKGDTLSGVTLVTPPQIRMAISPRTSAPPLDSARSTRELITPRYGEGIGEPVTDRDRDPGCCIKCVIAYLEFVADCFCCELSCCRDEGDNL